MTLCLQMRDSRGTGCATVLDRQLDWKSGDGYVRHEELDRVS